MKLPRLVCLLTVLTLSLCSSLRAELQAGAAVVDVRPSQYPVLVNGGMTSRTADKATSPISARAIVLDDGSERLAIVVVDSCMMSRPVLDEAKQLAATRTQLRPDRILISATHTHTAPASMGCLGTDADPEYIPVLRAGLVEALVKAEANLEPARVGWAVAKAPEFTALRRWIRRPDRLVNDPFGNPTVRASMHAGANWDNVVGESGPEDPDLSLISIQSASGRPIAVLANFSMHYFSGVPALNADYFGLFCEGLSSRISPKGDGPACVGVMSHGCSGDIWRRDYTKPPEQQLAHDSVEAYADGLAEIAAQAYESIEYSANADLAMDESRMRLNYRVPDQQRLEWAQRIVAEMGDRPLKTQQEVYAREQIILHERQSTEIVVQALRIGEIGIATTPNETYALTGLKIKRHSPLPHTMVIELANGGDGYIPPPEQHLLGGYNTWAARSAGLEVQAEPKITETALRLLESVAGRSRRAPQQGRGAVSEAVLAANPVAYWRLDEMSGPWAKDASDHGADAVYEPPVAFFLEGPRSDLFCVGEETNRSAHFAGGRLRSPRLRLGDKYSVSLWCWNGMPNDARDVTGWMMSQGLDHGAGPGDLHLGLGGTGSRPGRLIVSSGKNPLQPDVVVGETELVRWTWNHVVLIRDGKSLRVYLNGNAQPQIETTLKDSTTNVSRDLFFGGRCDNDSNWEGRLDEIALFDRALSPNEVRALAGKDD